MAYFRTTPLIEAITREDSADTIRNIIKRDPNDINKYIQAEFSRYWTALIFAIRKNSDQSTENALLLISTDGVDIDRAERIITGGMGTMLIHYTSALYYAAQYNNLRVVNALLAKGANPMNIDVESAKAIGYIEIAKSLERAQLKIRLENYLKDEQFNTTPLPELLRSKRDGAVRLLATLHENTTSDTAQAEIQRLLADPMIKKMRQGWFSRLDDLINAVINFHSYASIPILPRAAATPAPFAHAAGATRAAPIAVDPLAATATPAA
jgi:hypothetical protein